MQDLTTLRTALDHFYQASQRLTNSRDVEQAMPEVLAALSQLIRVRSALLIEYRSKLGKSLLWHGPNTSPSDLATVKARARETLAYLTGRPDGDLAFLTEVDTVVPELQQPEVEGRLITLPLALGGEPAFGVMVLDCLEADEAKLSVLNAIGNQLASAVDRFCRTEQEEQAKAREAEALAATAKRNQATADEALRHAALEASEKRFLSLTEAIPQMVWIAKEDGRLAYCNERWLSYAGLSLDAAQRIEPGSLVHPNDREATQLAWRQAWRDEKLFVAEHRLRAADGSYRWFLCRAVPEWTESGLRWLGTSTDIEQHKHLEAALTAAKAEAEESHRAKSSFLTNISHEIRTPLGVILGYAELMRDDDLAVGEKMSYLDKIRRNGSNLCHLINEILDLSKVEAEGLDLVWKHVSLPDLMTIVTSAMALKAKQKNLQFSVQSVGPLPETLLSDAMRLKQILFSVIDNAIKFTKSGSVAVRIKLLNSTTPLLEFAVTDTGCGISSEAQGRIFDAFVQADNTSTRAFGGAGLGLTLARKLAAALGGGVSLRESELGGGSTFVVTVATGPLEPGVPRVALDYRANGKDEGGTGTHAHSPSAGEIRDYPC